jgi:hypothetical protein
LRRDGGRIINDEPPPCLPHNHWAHRLAGRDGHTQPSIPARIPHCGSIAQRRLTLPTKDHAPLHVRKKKVAPDVGCAPGEQPSPSGRSTTINRSASTCGHASSLAHYGLRHLARPRRARSQSLGWERTTPQGLPRSRYPSPAGYELHANQVGEAHNLGSDAD